MKQVKTKNYRVVVEPRMYTYIRRYLTEEQYRRVCNEIIEQIKRHVDDVLDVQIEFDSEYTCEYCENTWEEDENGEPMCCGKAQEEWKSNQEKQ